MGTITKALELLDYFSRARPDLGLGDFVRLTGRDKATLHRHLVELEQNGFLEQHPATRAYRLGPAILRLSGVREVTHPVRSALRPVVAQLAAEVGELVHISLLQGRLLSPVVHADPLAHGTQVHFDESELLPLHATSSGLAVLAFADPSFAREVLARPLHAYTDRTITDPEVLRAMLSEIRATGLSRLAQAFDEEVSSQGAPIFGPAGELTGAVSIAVPHVRVTEARMALVTEALRVGVTRITATLGGTIPAEHAGKWTPSGAPLAAADTQAEPRRRRAGAT